MRLSRNFGQHIAISAGYRAATGDVVGVLNVDQEDPPSEVPKLLDALAGGAFDIVGGLYGHRKVKWTSRITSYLFHATMNKLTGYTTPHNASTLRVMTRRGALALSCQITVRGRLALPTRSTPHDGSPAAH